MSHVITSLDSKLLFRVLAANGAFSTVSGLALAIGAEPIAEWIGLPYPVWLAVVGLGLIAFGVRLLWIARARRIRRADAWLISVMDLAWVVATVVLAFGIPGLLTPTGTTAVLAVALVVLTFFDLQAYALWKTRG